MLYIMAGYALCQTTEWSYLEATVNQPVMHGLLVRFV